MLPNKINIYNEIKNYIKNTPQNNFLGKVYNPKSSILNNWDCMTLSYGFYNDMLSYKLRHLMDDDTNSDILSEELDYKNNMLNYSYCLSLYYNLNENDIIVNDGKYIFSDKIKNYLDKEMDNISMQMFNNTIKVSYTQEDNENIVCYMYINLDNSNFNISVGGEKSEHQIFVVYKDVNIDYKLQNYNYIKLNIISEIETDINYNNLHTKFLEDYYKDFEYDSEKKYGLLLNYNYENDDLIDIQDEILIKFICDRFNIERNGLNFTSVLVKSYETFNDREHYEMDENIHSVYYFDMDNELEKQDIIFLTNYKSNYGIELYNKYSKSSEVEYDGYKKDSFYTSAILFN